MHNTKKEMEKKFQRLMEFSEDKSNFVGNKNLYVGGKNPFMGKESISINGIPEWTVHCEFNKRIKEVDKAER